MPNIIVQNAEGQPELWENVNTVRFLNEEGGLVSYDYNSGEAPSEERPDLLPAPEGKVWVGFQDGDGSLLWNTLTDKGGSVEYPLEQPTPPEDDMEFVRWSWSKEDIRCIESDTVIAPVWKFKDFSIEDTIIKINTRFLGSSSLSVTFSFGNYDNEVTQGGQVDIDWGDGTTSVLEFPASRTYKQASHTFTQTDHNNFQYIVVKRSGNDYITLGYAKNVTSANYGDNRDLYYRYVSVSNHLFSSKFNSSVLAIQIGTYDKYIHKTLFYPDNLHNIKYIMIEQDYMSAVVLPTIPNTTYSIGCGLEYCVIPNTDMLEYGPIHNILNKEQTRRVHTFAFGKHINHVWPDTIDSTNYTTHEYIGDAPSKFAYSYIRNGVHTGYENSTNAKSLKYFTIPWTHLNIITYADYPKNQLKYRYLELEDSVFSLNDSGYTVLRTTVPNLCPDDVPIIMSYLCNFTNLYGVNPNEHKFRGTIWIRSMSSSTTQYPGSADRNMYKTVDLSEATIIYGSWNSITGQFIVSNTESKNSNSPFYGILANKLRMNYDKISLSSSPNGKFVLPGTGYMKDAVFEELTILGELKNMVDNSSSYSLGFKFYTGPFRYNYVRYNFPDTTKLPSYTFREVNIKDVVIPNVKTIPNYMFYSCVFESGRFVIPEGVIKIGNNVFQYCKISEIHIPSTVETIGNNFVYYCSEDSVPKNTNYPYPFISPSIFVHRDTPPVLGSNLFTTTDAKLLGPTPRIHVPKDSVDLYKSASGWSAYAGTIIGDL